MEHEIEFIFSKGGSFKAVLLDRDAPKTCEAFRTSLEKCGQKVQVRQARFSGQEIYFQGNFSLSDKENNIQPQFGDISFNTDGDWRAVCIYYGEDISQKACPFNLFARITKGINKVGEIGDRIWLKGEETALVRLAVD